VSRLHIFICSRCAALFGISTLTDTYAGQLFRDILEQNPCRVCGKGGVIYWGSVEITPPPETEGRK